MDKFLSYKGRSVWKGFFKNLNYDENNRTTVVTRRLLGKTLVVHNGKNWISVPIRKKHFGHKLGQFVYTKKMGKKIHEQVKGKGKSKGKGKKGK